MGLVATALPQDSRVSVNSVDLVHTSRGWLVETSPNDSVKTELHRDDLITELEGRQASIVGPLALINLFDESFSRPVQASILRSRDRVSINLRRPLPDSGPIRSQYLALNGFRAPAFYLTDLSGKKISLQAINSRWVLLTFGGTWCAECMAEIDSLKKLQKRYLGRLDVVMIALDDTDEKLRLFMRERKVTFSIINAGGTFSRLPIEFGVSSPKGNAEVPVNVLIRPDRSIAYVQVGAKGPSAIFTQVKMVMDPAQN